MSGTPVFAGTRVPFQTLIDYLKPGAPLSEFFEDFPTVLKEQAVAFTPDKDPDRAIPLNDLGISLAKRYERLGSGADLSQAAAKFRK